MFVDFLKSLLSPSILAITLVLIVVYKLIIENWNFFKNVGIKYVRCVPILGIQYEMLFGKKSSFQAFLDLYRAHSDEQVIGTYDLGGTPIYVINDIDLAKRIMNKDFDSFVNHRFQIDKHIDPLLARSMFATKDKHWKDIRSTTSPAFTGKVAYDSLI